MDTSTTPLGRRRRRRRRGSVGSLCRCASIAFSALAPPPPAADSFVLGGGGTALVPSRRRRRRLSLPEMPTTGTTAAAAAAAAGSDDLDFGRNDTAAASSFLGGSAVLDRRDGDDDDDGGAASAASGAATSAVMLTTPFPVRNGADADTGQPQPQIPPQGLMYQPPPSPLTASATEAMEWEVTEATSPERRVPYVVPFVAGEGVTSGAGAGANAGPLAIGRPLSPHAKAFVPKAAAKSAAATAASTPAIPAKEEEGEFSACVDSCGRPAYERVDYEGNCVRIQAGADECVCNVRTVEDAWRRIGEVRREMEDRYGEGGGSNGRGGGEGGGGGGGGVEVDSSLYQRGWVLTKSSGTKAKEGGETPASSFTVCQFNVLAEGLSSAPTYGGFTAVPKPEVSLDFRWRRWRLLEVLLGGYIRRDAPDAAARTNSEDSQTDAAKGGIEQQSPLPFEVIALEELDHHHSFFDPLLSNLGYSSLFIPKPHSPSVNYGYYSDGCALFWSRAKFKLIAERRGRYDRGNQVYVIAALRHKESGNVVVFGTTHLKAKKGKANEARRARQARELMAALGEVRAEVAAAMGMPDEEDVPVVLMGDFNAEPNGRCVSTVLNDRHIKLESAYDMDEEGAYTTWKTRGEGTVRRVIDYIFHTPTTSSTSASSGSRGTDIRHGGDGTNTHSKGSKERDAHGAGIACTHVLSVPEPDDVEGHGLPGMRQPSDHFSLGAKFEFLTS